VVSEIGRRSSEELDFLTFGRASPKAERWI
jgi:uncharacterized protein YacL